MLFYVNTNKVSMTHKAKEKNDVNKYFNTFNIKIKILNTFSINQFHGNIKSNGSQTGTMHQG